MQSSNLIRWAGLAAVLSGVSSVIGDLLSLVVDLESAESAATTPYMLVFLLYLLGTVLLLLGLVGLYSSSRSLRAFWGSWGFWLRSWARHWSRAPSGLSSSSRLPWRSRLPNLPKRSWGSRGSQSLFSWWSLVGFCSAWLRCAPASTRGWLLRFS